MVGEDDSRWIEARDRMRPYIDAVFWQEIGIPSPEKEIYVDWILDKIIKKEYLSALPEAKLAGD